MRDRLQQTADSNLTRMQAWCAWPVLAIVMMTASGSGVGAQPDSCLVTTAHGDVAGTRRGGVCTYLGVPYAAPPVGALRWRPPQPPNAWAPATLSATTAPAICPQFNLAGTLAGNEDCLTLNIWTPTVKSHRRGVPVIVWLHPGSFQAASSNLAASNGERFAAERGAIVVAPNYRLGPFGFLAHNAFALEDSNYPSSGNYGLADQRAALQWVRNSIADFGGDPDNVTLAGTSAGAVSVSLHLVSPFTRGLFQRAIIQSGYAFSRWRTTAESEGQGVAFANALGCADPASAAACLRSKSRDQVLAALPIGQMQVVEQEGRVAWEPVVDGFEVRDQPRELFRRGQFARMPVIIGANRDEGWTFVDRSFPGGLDALQYERAVRTEFGMDAEAVLRIYPATSYATPKDALARLTSDVEFVCEARRAARVLHHDGAPVFLYSFEYTVEPVTPGRAFHGLETNLLFGNNFAAPSNHVLAPADIAVFGTISSYWREFAETGSPNHPDNPVQWPAFRPDATPHSGDLDLSDRYLRFDRTASEGRALRDSHCNFWESFYFRSVLGTTLAAAAR